jgi:hypothetical protein
MAPQQPAECLGLGLAELGVLPCDVSHGAVVLAHLNACRRRIDTGGESKVAQGGRERVHLVAL